MRCAVCKGPMTASEVAAYKTRCEDCWCYHAPKGRRYHEEPGYRKGVEARQQQPETRQETTIRLDREDGE